MPLLSRLSATILLPHFRLRTLMHGLLLTSFPHVSLLLRLLLFWLPVSSPPVVSHPPLFPLTTTSP